MIEICVNGENLSVENGVSIARLLEILSIRQELVAVAVNAQVVKKDAWSVVSLNPADKVEILQFMSGG